MMEKHFAQAPVFESLFFPSRERERSPTKTSFIIVKKKKKKKKRAAQKKAAEAGGRRKKEKGGRQPEKPTGEIKTPYLEAILLYFLFKVHEKKRGEKKKEASKTIHINSTLLGAGNPSLLCGMEKIKYKKKKNTACLTKWWC